MNKSINPYVTVKGNILVSKCCGSEMAYRFSETNTINSEWDYCKFDMFDFCPQCLDCCDTFEVKASDYDRDLYLDENDNFNFEAYDSKNFEIIPICDSKVYTSKKELIESGDFSTDDLDITLDNNGDIYEIKRSNK